MAWVKGVKVPRKVRKMRERAQDTKRKDDSEGKGKGEGEGEGEAESDKWDDVCAICDDGWGDDIVVCCEGGCLRSFHPTTEHGRNSKCRTLRLTTEEWECLQPENVPYECDNCKHKQHQCFACGKLGSSDLLSGAEVFQCKGKKCGHFFHPDCVSKLLRADSNIQDQTKFAQRIAGGLEFLCPVHKCIVCKGAGNKDDKEMQLAVCRRCPTAYHRKCLPSGIAFKDSEEGLPQRAWNGLLPDEKILIYCMEHEIVPELRTPLRKHIKFPVAKRPEDAPSEQDIRDVIEMLDASSSGPSDESPVPAETDHEPSFTCNHRDSFAPKALFPCPHPGSCGWLDD